MMKPIERVRRWWHGGEDAAVPAQSPSDGAPAKNGSNGKHGSNGKNGRPLDAAAREAHRRDPPWMAAMDEAGIPRSLTYPGTTLGRLLDQTADRFADATAIVYGESRWTYGELLAQVNRMAGGLAGLGVRRGERVLMVLPNCPEF